MQQDQIIHQVKRESKNKKRCQRFRNLCEFMTSTLKLLPIIIRLKRRSQGSLYQAQVESPKSLMTAATLEGFPVRKLLVLDLDETLVHSQFDCPKQFDFTVDITMADKVMKVYVIVRPYAVEFLKRLSVFYDICLFTASLREYADPVMDYIDPERVTRIRLFRESCKLIRGALVKDLRQFDRPLKDIIIIDNNEFSFILQPQNAIHIQNFYDDPNDVELIKLEPFLITVSHIDDVRSVSERLNSFFSMDSDRPLMSEELDEKTIPKLAIRKDMDPLQNETDKC